MKGRLVVMGQIGAQRGAALFEDGVLQDLLMDPATTEMPTPGSILCAVCDRPLKGQGGMMMRLPNGTGFLRQGKGLAPGQSLLVQVTGYAEPGKAVPLTAKVIFKSRYCIVTPGAPGINISRAIRDDDIRDELLGIANSFDIPDGLGLIIRSISATAPLEEIAEDIAQTVETAVQITAAAGTDPELLLEGPDAHLLAWRDWEHPDAVEQGDTAFEDHGVLDQIDLLRGDHVALESNSSMYIEPTRALIAVDINTGGDTSPAAGLKANLAAARALPRQLRCRGLGGQITMDLAPMPKKDRRAFENALRSAMRADSVETTLVGFTPLGHYELQRKRERLPLSESLPK